MARAVFQGSGGPVASLLHIRRGPHSAWIPYAGLGGPRARFISAGFHLVLPSLALLPVCTACPAWAATLLNLPPAGTVPQHLAQRLPLPGLCSQLVQPSICMFELPMSFFFAPISSLDFQIHEDREGVFSSASLH